MPAESVAPVRPARNRKPPEHYLHQKIRNSQTYQLHSLRIGRTGAWDAGIQTADGSSLFDAARRKAEDSLRKNTVNGLTGHTSDHGTEIYIREQVSLSIAADRAAACAVMSPAEELFKFHADRSQGRSIVVRRTTDGTYVPVSDSTPLSNYEDDDDVQSDEGDDSDDDSGSSSDDTTDGVETDDAHLSIGPI
jgi:hypothetical protein